jgi:TRAP-type mannitol/chloroaromatic compound transport system permease small subunit
MFDFIVWVLQNIALAPYHLFLAITNPGQWLFWENREALVRFIYYGGSVEFFFVVFTTFLVITALGMAWKREILWGCVRGLEAFANAVGRVAAWAGLIMVLQQVMIVFLQRIFRVSEIQLGPLGTAFTQDLSWWGEELKLYNALVVCLCVSYTFVQGGHVRVDLVYSSVRFRTKRMIDMFGSVVFMMPTIVLTYMYGWFFLWRHLVVPNPSASTELDRMLMQAAVMRWNVETIGFSPNGFNAYFLFKVLIVAFCVMVFLQACAFFWRSYLEWLEGEESAGKYLDRDSLGNEAEEMAHKAHSGAN